MNLSVNGKCLRTAGAGLCAITLHLKTRKPCTGLAGKAGCGAAFLHTMTARGGKRLYRGYATERKAVYGAVLRRRSPVQGFDVDLNAGGQGK